MIGMKKKFIAFGLGLVLAGFIAFEFLKPESSLQLPDGFTKTAFVRNENNMGVVLLYYAFSVADTTGDDYELLGNSLPYNKHNGITTVFFFDEKKPVPNELQLQYPHFDTTKYYPVAVYVKDQEGKVAVKRPNR